MSTRPARPTVSRRAVLRGAALGAGLLAAPAVATRALGAAPVVNFLGWSGYDLSNLFALVRARTGIEVAFTDAPDQASMLAEAQLALQTGTIDLIEPTLDVVQPWVAAGVLQPWEEGKLSLDATEPALLGGRAGDLASAGGRRYLAPSVWGTEALLRTGSETASSLADLFTPAPTRHVALRAHSGLAALGRVLDAEGKLPRPFVDGYRDEAAMRQVWDAVLAEALRRKKALPPAFWVGETDAEGAFRAGDATLGLVWDTTGRALAGAKATYVTPGEGAFAWMQGYVLHARSANVEAAHAVVRFLAGPEGSAAAATAFSASPSGRGALDRMAAAEGRFERAAYTGDALARLWWWPAQPDWFLTLRGQYADRYRDG